MKRHISILVAALCLATVGCGGDSGEPDGHGHHHSGDGEHDHYTPGMERLTDAGLFEVAFYSEPAPTVGLHQFMLSIRDAMTEAPVEGATIAVDLSMPDHGHGSDRVPVVEVDGPGIYRVENVSLHMMGIWQIDLTIEAEAGTDTVTFRFDV